MANFGPSWTDSVVVQAPYALIKTSGLIRSTTGLDLRAKYGGFLKLAVGTGGATALTNGVDAIVRRTLGNAAVSQHKYSAPYAAFRSRTAAGLRLLNNGAGYAAGSSSFAFDGATGTAHAVGDLLFFWGIDSGAGIPTASGAITPNHGCEVLRCSSGTSTPFITDSPSLWDHHDNEYVGNADAWELWLPGGATYELIFDYGNNAAGEAVAVMADIQTYDKTIKVT